MQDNAVSLRPPRQRLLLVITAFLALIVGDGGPGVEACSRVGGVDPPSDIEMVISAPVVLYGQVRAAYPYEHTINSSEVVYTAHVEVYCVMKGDRTDQFVNISHTGERINQSINSV